MTNHDKSNNYQQKYLKDIIIQTLISDDLNEAIKNISMELGKLFNADRVYFRLYDKSLKIFSEVIEEYRKNETIPSAKGKMIYFKEFDTYLNDKLTTGDNIFIIDDINKSEYSESFKELFRSLNIKNEIVLPIFYRNELESAFFITNIESSELLSRGNFDFLLSIAKQISIGTHMFKLNETLNKIVNYEEILREAIFKVRLYDNPEDVFKYLANSLSDLYKVNRIISLNIDSLGDHIVLYETLKDLNPELKGKIIFKPESFKEITGYTKDSIVIVNDTVQIKNQELQNCLNNNGIKAFMLYPIEELVPIKGGKKIEEKIMVCSDIPKKWSQQDIDALKLIIGTITIIYVDIRNRKEIRAIEETFTASLVHDLKSPLYAEQKALEFITSRKPDTTIQSILPYLDDIYKTNEESLRLITNLLTVYSLEFGQQELKKEPVNINKIIDNAIRSIKPLADDNESKIVKNIQENLEEVYMDPDEIKRVFANLLSNAINHNIKGIQINITAERKEDEIFLSVSDNGIGISEIEKKNIFQKYKTTKRNVSSGLGLYLSKQIVEHHGGIIWFESEEGKGTTFYFTLPLTIKE
ncbi:MAG: GAF domain-containing sensor histidine kinase [Candidatus Gastranaerophilales bacterium]|nr:GAF domain-containing sensor histidine kinase [Candidatus Gastranaerophilales bacterium]